jgi:hypothetical protein
LDFIDLRKKENRATVYGDAHGEHPFQHYVLNDQTDSFYVTVSTLGMGMEGIENRAAKNGLLVLRVYTMYSGLQKVLEVIQYRFFVVWICACMFAKRSRDEIWPSIITAQFGYCPKSFFINHQVNVDFSIIFVSLCNYSEEIAKLSRRALPSGKKNDF